MAKLEEKQEIKTKKVEFDKPWQGSFNNYKILVTKRDVIKGNVKRELPLVVYDWIQKFKVTKDA